MLQDWDVAVAIWNTNGSLLMSILLFGIYTLLHHSTVAWTSSINTPYLSISERVNFSKSMDGSMRWIILHVALISPFDSASFVTKFVFFRVILSNQLLNWLITGCKDCNNFLKKLALSCYNSYLCNEDFFQWEIKSYEASDFFLAHFVGQDLTITWCTQLD